MNESLMIGIGAFVVVAILAYWLWSQFDWTEETDRALRTELATEFLGGVLYEVSVTQLENYLELYKTKPSQEVEDFMLRFVKNALSCHIARGMTEEEIEYLAKSNTLHDIDGVVERMNIHSFIPSIKRYALEEKLPTMRDLSATPTFVGQKIYYLDRELIKLLDAVNARRIEREHKLEKTNA